MMNINIVEDKKELRILHILLLTNLKKEEIIKILKYNDGDFEEIMEKLISNNVVSLDDHEHYQISYELEANKRAFMSYLESMFKRDADYEEDREELFKFIREIS